MPRVGFAWDPTGARHMVGPRELRPLLRPIPERRRHRVAGAGQLDALGAVQSVQRRRPQLRRTRIGARLSGAEYVRAAVHRVRDRHGRAKPPYAQNWNLSVQRSLFDKYLLEVRYVGAQGHASAAQHRSQPGRVRPGRHGAERRPPAHLCQLPGGRRHLRLLDHRDAVGHHELDLSRRPGECVAALFGRRRLQRVVLVLEVARLPVGDESVGRGRQAAGGRERSRTEPVRPGAEHGPSLFDARHRFVASASWEPRVPDARRRPSRDPRRLAAERDCHASIRARRSRSPIRRTSSLQANSPPISGFRGEPSRPDRRSQRGPHTVDEWISRVGVPASESANTGGAVRQRGPQHRARSRLHRRRRVAGAELRRSARTRLQFRFEVFNVANPGTSGSRWRT